MKIKRKPRNPITKVHTGMGNNGETFFQGLIVKKDDELIEFVGDLDEACAYLGKVKLVGIEQYQRILFEIGAMTHSITALESYKSNLDSYTKEIIKHIDEIIIKNELPELSGFIVPTKMNADTMIVRAIIRRVERLAVRAKLTWVVPFLNAFSDYLFICAWQQDCSKQWIGFQETK
jgi:ATP:cob(I)alamin adenosyltransferase